MGTRWINAFQAAILEVDAARLPERVAQAKYAILDRIEALHGVNAESEGHELRVALQTLSELANFNAREPRTIRAGHDS
jgi:hypothetical protein